MKFKNNEHKATLEMLEDFGSLEPTELLKKINSLSEHTSGNLDILIESPKEALLILTAYVESIDRKTPVPNIIERYVANSFRVILSGFPIERDQLEKAFHLKGTKKGATPRFNERNFSITNEVIDLMDEGKSLNEASNELADVYHRESSVIRKAYRKNKDEVQFFRDLLKDEPVDSIKGTPLSKILE